jgi:hypothetical protein
MWTKHVMLDEMELSQNFNNVCNLPQRDESETLFCLNFEHRPRKKREVIDWFDYNWAELGGKIHFLSYLHGGAREVQFANDS